MSNASLPAAPLAAVIDRILARVLVGENPASTARTIAYQDLAVNPRTVWAWRATPRATVTFSVADRVLSCTPYLWFDVWPACEDHEEPEAECLTCLVHYRARRLFTGRSVPKAMRRRT